MASRAEVRSAEGGPRLGAALHAALVDFYYNSLRLVGANLVWTAALVLAYLVVPIWTLGTVALLILAALPTGGLFRLAALIARGEPASIGDVVGWWRRRPGATIGLGAIGLVWLAVGGTNAVGGVQSADALGWAFATLAFWGLAVGWVAAWVAWPLLVDPWRDGRPLRDTLRLTGYLVLAFPGRFVALGLVLAVVVAVSVAAVVAIATISMAYAAIVAGRFVLPAADRLEAQLAARDITFGAPAGRAREPDPTG